MRGNPMGRPGQQRTLRAVRQFLLPPAGKTCPGLGSMLLR
jgi:hypothetical protein